MRFASKISKSFLVGVSTANCQKGKESNNPHLYNKPADTDYREACLHFFFERWGN